MTFHDLLIFAMILTAVITYPLFSEGITLLFKHTALAITYIISYIIRFARWVYKMTNRK